MFKAWFSIVQQLPWSVLGFSGTAHASLNIQLESEKQTYRSSIFFRISDCAAQCRWILRLNGRAYLIDGIITDSVRDVLEVLPDVEGDLLARPADPHGSSTGGILHSHSRADFL